MSDSNVAHDVVSFKGSTKHTHVEFCEDCQTVLSEETQAEYKARLAAQGIRLREAQSANSGVSTTSTYHDISKDQSDERTITFDQCDAMMAMVAAQVVKMASALSGCTGFIITDEEAAAIEFLFAERERLEKAHRGRDR